MKNIFRTIILLSLFGCNIENSLVDPEPPTPRLLGEPSEPEDIWAEDTFHEYIRQPVDILFVIDPSCSMSDNIHDISGNIPRFIGELEEHRLDYHIGVISTHATESYPRSGMLNSFAGVRVITPETENPQGIFYGLTWVYGDLERGFDAIWAALSPDMNLEENVIDFLRWGAPLHIIVISDEEDQSVWTDYQDILSLLAETRRNKNASVSMSSITHDYTTFSGCSGPSETIGFDYMLAATKSGGVNVNICEEDWSDALARLAAYSIPPAKYEYLLSNYPVVNTIEIKVEDDGVIIDLSEPLTIENGLESGDYYYDRIKNSVVMLDYKQEYPEIVSVTYKVKDK